jgi:hypothetical protein
VPVGPDGSFRIRGVPPGDYQLHIQVAGPAVGKPTETDTYYAGWSSGVEIKPTPPGHGDKPMSLGSIVLRNWARSE